MIYIVLAPRLSVFSPFPLFNQQYFTLLRWSRNEKITEIKAGSLSRCLFNRLLLVKSLSSSLLQCMTQRWTCSQAFHKKSTVFFVTYVSCTSIILPLDILVASYRIPWKNKNAVYRFQISSLVPEIFVFKKKSKICKWDDWWCHLLNPI